MTGVFITIASMINLPKDSTSEGTIKISSAFIICGTFALKPEK
jgi:hypothetical protein